MENLKNFLRENFKLIWKYLSSGVLSVGVDYAILYLLTSIFGVYYLYSTIFSFLAGFLTNFFLNKYWTFKKEGDTISQMVKYGILAGINLLVTLGLMYLLTTNVGINYLISRGMVLVVVTGWNFLLYKYVVYK